MDALKIGTCNAAELMKKQNEIGSLEAG